MTDFNLLHKGIDPTSTSRLSPPSPKAVKLRFWSFIMHPFTQRASIQLPISTTTLRYASAPTTIKMQSDYPLRSMDDFMREVSRLFEQPLQLQNLLSISSRLQSEFAEKLQTSKISMLPSYTSTLPTGNEKGSYLALDVGGSTLRLALVELQGRIGNEGRMKIIKMFSYKIDNAVRALKGREFFDWMADRITDLVSNPEVQRAHSDAVYDMGVAWSFPIEQTSIRTGKLLDMGKGFHASHGVAGEDLSCLITQACQKKGLKIRIDAVVNDGSATLLSRAYSDSLTRFGLILGTGTNMSIMLPVTALSDGKFTNRPASWKSQATDVLVNTEFSMFGKGILPATRWDELLNRKHRRPDFQPFEYLMGGHYLSEIVRLVLVEAVSTARLFRGQVPDRLLEPYSLDTSTLAAIEGDESSDLHNATVILQQRHPLLHQPSSADMHYVRQITKCVTQRASALLATAIHSLWYLRATTKGHTPIDMGPVTIGCNGSVIERYPQFRSQTQRYLNQLTMLSGAGPNVIGLEMAMESALFGAAVAVACLEGS